MKRDEEWTRSERIGLAIAVALAVIALAAAGGVVWLWIR
jgi:hypothetical protein